jgi:hypothetical protein
VTDSLIFLPLRLGLRTARASLHAARDLADLGLATLEIVERVLGDEHPDVPDEPAHAVEPFEPADAVEPIEPADAVEPIEPADAVEPIEPADADEPIEPADADEPIEPGDAVEPADADEPFERGDAVEPAGPAPLPVEPSAPPAVERSLDGGGQEPAPPAPAPPPELEREPLPGGDELLDEVELVDEVADPGAEDGAGASLRVAPPFAGYDELRAADVIARLGGADLAELGETELYERTHRARRTVLDAIAREIKRRPPNWVAPRP